MVFSAPGLEPQMQAKMGKDEQDKYACHDFTEMIDPHGHGLLKAVKHILL